MDIRWRLAPRKPDTDRPDGASLLTFQAYLYTVVTIANGAQPRTVEAELWWNRPADKDGGRWYYFRRYSDKTAEAAVRRVERDFKVWAEGQRGAVGE
jgi:hypothetical protein